jgi:hypothetical protein
LNITFISIPHLGCDVKLRFFFTDLNQQFLKRWVFFVLRKRLLQFSFAMLPNNIKIKWDILDFGGVNLWILVQLLIHKFELLKPTDLVDYLNIEFIAVFTKNSWLVLEGWFRFNRLASFHVRVSDLF